MERQIIWRGLLAGAAAGVLAFLFARLFVEPQIDRAIGYEDGVGAAQPPGAGGGKAGNHRFHLSKSLNTCCRGGMESALGQERG